MSFNAEVLKPGRGRCILVEGSTDNFATITYRWGEMAGLLDGANMFSSRVLSCAPVRRALGQNRLAASSTCELVLDNADGALDALASRTSLSTQAKLRFRIWLDIFDPVTLPADLSANAHLLGVFSLSEWIRQDNTRLVLPLADDVMGAVAQQAALPTFWDWHAVGGSAATNPLFDGFGLPDSETQYTPVQLAFGEDWVLAHPHVLPFGSVDAAYQGKVIVPICCTSSTAAASSTEITELRVSWLDGNSKKVRLIDLPKTVSYNDSSGALVTANVWTIERSPTITKNGHSFKVIYLVVRSDLGAINRLSNYINGNHVVTDPSVWDSYASADYANEWLGNYAPYPTLTQRDWASNNPQNAQYAQFAAGVLAWYVKGVPFSARTQTTVAVQHPVDVLTDLVTYYSNNTSIVVDAVAAPRVKAATPMAACAGIVQPWVSGPKRGDPVFQQPPSLRQIISAICQSSDIDCFIDWGGQFSFSTDFWDFRISTPSSGTASWSPDGGYSTSGNGTTTSYNPTVIPETWLQSMERWIPSNGERWAPYNRLWFNGARLSPGDGITTAPFQGPWDMDTGQPGAIALADKIIEATLEQGWRPYRQQAQAPWFRRQLNIVARDMVRFRTHIGGLQLELGQYFALSWSRGPTLAGPYSGTIFQVEGITYSPADDSVEVTAIWRDDITTEQQYLLDDESLIVRGKGALTGSATVDVGGTQVDFGGTINLTTMGVTAGDIIIFKDSVEAADTFFGWASYRVSVVDSTTRLHVATTLDANSNVTIINADWSIQRGATTYPTVGSDPTNYPLGGDPYGKVTNTAGVQSNSAAGNRLISG